jgi:hypothetical protein
MPRAACRRVGWEGCVGGVGEGELILLGARVVRSIVHVAGRVFVVLCRQVAVVVKCSEWVVGGATIVLLTCFGLCMAGPEQRAQVPSDE